MRHIISCFKFILVLGLGMMVAACGRSDPEQALRGTVDQLQQAVQARNTSGVLEHIAEDFVRESAHQAAGGMDKPQVRALLAAAFLRNEKITLATTVREVKINGTLATARIHVRATGGTGLLPERADGWEFTTAWRQEGKAWRLYNAQWNN